MGKKVLLIDDDPELGRLVEMVLRPVEAIVYQSFSGSEGLKRAYDLHPDLIILDIMMPSMDGFEVLTRLREMSCVPVLMLTARTNETDMLRGFKAGADDFVRKPFNKNELEARVRALLRRLNSQDFGGGPNVTAYSDSILDIDLVLQTVRLNQEVVELTPKEYSVLACLVREKGRVVSQLGLVKDVWGEMYLSAPALSSLYIYYLRKKLQDGQHGHKYIHTLWRRGYWFEPRKEG